MLVQLVLQHEFSICGGQAVAEENFEAGDILRCRLCLRFCSEPLEKVFTAGIGDVINLFSELVSEVSV